MAHPTTRLLDRRLILTAGLLLAAACGRDPTPTTREVTAWRKLGTWSGGGPISTGPFISDTGTLRLVWETRNEKLPGKGFFKLTVYSDVSGRPLVLAVDHLGVGGDTVYVNEDPRPFYLGIESAHLDWSVSVDEAIPAIATEPVRP